MGSTTVLRHLEKAQDMLLQPLQHLTAVKKGCHCKHPGWKPGRRLGLCGEGVRSPLWTDCHAKCFENSSISVMQHWQYVSVYCGESLFSANVCNGKYLENRLFRAQKLPAQCFWTVVIQYKFTVCVYWFSSRRKLAPWHSRPELIFWISMTWLKYRCLGWV